VLRAHSDTALAKVYMNLFKRMFFASFGILRPLQQHFV
jgi:hypothetical protein